MDNQNNTWAWIVGVVVLILVIAGLWWYFGSAQSGTGKNNMATTTSESMAATTTTTANTTSGTLASEDRTSSTVAGVIAGLADASQANALFSSTGVSASLTGKGPYTVFVPINEAFANVSPGVIAKMTAAQKKRMAQYHVVVGKKLDDNAVSSGNYLALSKDSLNFNVRADNGSAYVNSGLVIKQYKASNGIVYLISAVLIPPTAANPQTGH